VRGKVFLPKKNWVCQSKEPHSKGRKNLRDDQGLRRVEGEGKGGGETNEPVPTARKEGARGGKERGTRFMGGRGRRKEKVKIGN